MLSTEINQADLIQKTFYKQKYTDFEGWELAYMCLPMAGVTGDLYDIYTEKESASSAGEKGKLKGLGLYDISGHGISSGIITLLAKNLISQEFYENEKLGIVDMMNKINDRVIVEKGDIENYITGILVRVKKINSDNSAELEFVNAGHQAPLLYHKKTDSLEILKNSSASSGAIGLSAIQSTYAEKKIHMEAGDQLILYTDGITDCIGPHKKELSLQGFADILIENISKPVEQQVQNIMNQLSAYKAEESAKDDMTILIMRYTGN